MYSRPDPCDLCADNTICNVSALADFYCSCPPNLIGNPYESCFAVESACASTPCANNGICVSTDSSYTCNCTAGFEGADCTTDIDECRADAVSPCQTRAVCNNTVGGYICSCPGAFPVTTSAACLPEPQSSNWTHLYTSSTTINVTLLSSSQLEGLLSAAANTSLTLLNRTSSINSVHTQLSLLLASGDAYLAVAGPTVGANITLIDESNVSSTWFFDSASVTTAPPALASITTVQPSKLESTTPLPTNLLSSRTDASTPWAPIAAGVAGVLLVLGVAFAVKRRRQQLVQPADPMVLTANPMYGAGGLGNKLGTIGETTEEPSYYATIPPASAEYTSPTEVGPSSSSVNVVAEGEYHQPSSCVPEEQPATYATTA